jgi:hypothetical protein
VHLFEERKLRFSEIENDSIVQLNERILHVPCYWTFKNGYRIAFKFLFFFIAIYGVESSHPLLTYIVVKKQYNTRFFTLNEATREINNMSIGTVIDTAIVHPYQYNFYLNSHKVHQGINRPPLYHVLLDEIGFTADQLQLLTYHLCFTDPRSSTTEAIPSVVHQATIAALKARDLFDDDEGYVSFIQRNIFGINEKIRVLVH